MLASKYTFYRDCLTRWVGDRSSRVLVVGAGVVDADVFREAGFTDVVLTDVDPRVFGEGGAARAQRNGYRVELADVEALPYADESFDYVVAHAMLHHCRSPHRAILEMYRVARRGIVAIEARDSALMRLAERLRLTNRFEVQGVIEQGGTRGGVANTEVPNFVYRFTEREMVKLITCWRPEVRHGFDFDYATMGSRLLMWRQSKRAGERLLGRVAELTLAGLTRVFPRQQNLFAMHVRKPPLPAGLQPWMRLGDDGRPTIDLGFRSWA